HRDRAVFSQMDASADVFCATAGETAATTTAPLLSHGRNTCGNEQTGAEDLHKRPALQAKTIIHWLKRLFIKGRIRQGEERCRRASFFWCESASLRASLFCFCFFHLPLASNFSAPFAARWTAFTIRT